MKNNTAQEQQSVEELAVYIDLIQTCEDGGFEATIANTKGKVAMVYGPTVRDVEERALYFCRGYNQSVKLATTPPKAAQQEASRVYRWVKIKELPTDWEKQHFRYVSDHYPLDASLFEERDGGLVKIDGVGRFEYSEIELLQPIAAQPSNVSEVEEAEEKRWHSTEAFIATCKAVEKIEQTQQTTWSIADVNELQDLLKEYGFSIQPLASNQKAPSSEIGDNTKTISND